MTGMVPTQLARAAIALGAVLSLSACFDHDLYVPGAGDGPGSEAWGSPNVACSVNADCRSGEMCLDSVCQIERCQDGPYFSVPPVGSNYFFFQDADIAVTDATAYDGDYWLDGYLAGATSGGYHGSWDLGPAPIVDLAGGNVTGERPEELVAAMAGTREVSVANSSGTSTFDIGLVPVGIATADTNADGTADLVGINASATTNICDVADTRKCVQWAFEDGAGLRGLDVTGGDVDGDGLEEAIVLVDDAGTSLVVALNPDADDTSQEPSWGFSFSEDLHKIEAGDLDGDGVDELIGLHDGSCNLFGCNADVVYVFTMYQGGSELLGSWPANDNTLDIALGDADMDGTEELFILRDDRRVRVARATSVAQFETMYETPLSVDQNPRRLTAADFDGDSPAAKLKDGPELIYGRPVPMVAAFYPPYWAELSDTPANLYVGRSDVEAEAFSDTVMTKAGIELGVSGSLFDIFSAEASGKLSQTVSRKVTTRSTRFIGDRVWSQARPDIYGPHYGGVLVSYTCYHNYTYEMDDPAHRLGGDGEDFVLVVPVEGVTGFLSTMRYNAMAERLGGLPIIEVPHTIGDPTTYPNNSVKINGDPIPTADVVIENPPQLMVSDVGFVGFWYALWEFNGVESAMSTELSLSTAFKVPGFKFGTENGIGWGRSHSLEIGKDANFGGMLPSLPDDPSTPEDEYGLYNYNFAPIIYREHYTDPDGNDAVYYVYHFMVGL